MAILGVAGGRIGAIKSIEHLRGVVAHVGGLALPGSVSVANAGKVFDESGAVTNEYVEKDIRRLARKLVNYIYETTCPDISMEHKARNE